jgi:hypothetical protein
MEYQARTRQESRYHQRMAFYWHHKTPQLQKLLDGWGVEYPAKNLFIDEEKYRQELIKIVIQNEPRIA